MKKLVIYFSISIAGLFSEISAQSVCAGNTIVLTAPTASAVTNPTYAINPGAITSTSPNFTVSPAVTTTYTLYMAGFNGSSIVTATAFSTVTVYAQPSAAPTLTQANCNSANVIVNLNLSFIPSGPVPAYTVSFPTNATPNGWIGNTTTSVSGAVTPGPYSATITTNNGCNTVANFTVLQAPAPASFNLIPSGPAYTITCNQPSLNIGASNSSNTYTWTSSSTPPITGMQVSVTSINAGMWTVSSTNTLSGCVKTSTFSVVVNTLIPVATISPTFQSINCNINSITTVTLISTNPTTNIQHIITPPQGLPISSNNQSVLFMPGTSGIYTHVLTNNANGCSVTKTFTVFSSQGYPTYSVVSPQNFTLGCSTKSIAVIAYSNASTIPPGGAISYSLLTAGSSTTTQSGILNAVSNYTVSSAGSYTAVTRDNSNGCETRIPFTVITNTLPPTIDSVGFPFQILDCDNPKVLLHAYGNPAYLYSWDYAGATVPTVGDTLSAYSNPAAPTLTLTNNYTLTIVDNNNLCQSTTVIPIYQNLFPPIAKISDGGNSTLGCGTSTLLLSNQSSSGIPQSTGFPHNLNVVGFLWSGPPPQQNLSNSSGYVASVAGIYTLVAKDLNNGCTSSTIITITNNTNTPLVNNPVAPDPVCLDGPVVAISPIITSPTTNLVYSWLSPPNSTVTGANTATLTTNAYGTYTVVVTNTSDNCSSSGLLHVINCSGVGISVQSRTDLIKVFPNPGNGLYNIVAAESVSRLEVYNLTGSLLKNVTADTLPTIDLRFQPAGIYFLKFTLNETVVFYKVIKE
jgi:hypothetical protein